jgi:hypothetical protein
MCHPLLTPEVARARASIGDEEEADSERRRAAQEALLDEVAAFTRNHPEVAITPPWELDGGCHWRVSVAGMSAEYDDPQFMLTILAERWGYES